MATNKTRIHDEPAFVLHHYDWSESSLILEMFTRHHGRVALAAKGVKRPSSQFRPVLLPLQPLRIGYSGDAEVRTLKSAEWVGGHIMPQGDALLSGYYLNELIMRLLARDDAHPRLFDLYAQVVQIVAADHEGMTAPALRTFELLLLRDVGLLPDLSCQTLTMASLNPDSPYCLLAEAGLREMNPQDRAGLRGQDWLDLQQALNDAAELTTTLRLCAQWPSETRQALQTQLRHLLHYHCGVQTLRTRQVLMDLQSL
ncbi:MAG: hypothetical protein RLZZ24_839 [Pseudomonadota bacterium]